MTDPKSIRIDYGTVTAVTVTCGQQIEPTPDIDPAIGESRFLVSVVMADDSECGLWSGADYEEAIRQAEHHRVAWEIDEPVHDNVAWPK